MNPQQFEQYFNKRILALIFIPMFIMTTFTVILLFFTFGGSYTYSDLLDELVVSPLEINSTPDNSSVPTCSIPTKLCPSTRDKREYEYFVLPNELRVVVICDPKTKLLAVAMTADTGSFNDPPCHPGLSHLCEHMLLLGTTKYRMLGGYLII